MERLGWLPIVRQQLANPFVGMGREALKDIRQVMVRIHIIFFASLCKRVHDSRCLTPFRAPHEEIILSANDDRLNRSFCPVVINFETTILKEGI